MTSEEEKPTSQVVIGIDLGTTYSCVGVWLNDQVEIVSNDQGNRTTPSWVAFTKHERLIGEAAKSQASSNPTNTIFDAKRFMGKKYSDPLLENDKKHLSVDIISKNDKPYFRVDYQEESREFSPEEVSAMILTRMKEIAEAYVGQPVTDAVITVPAYFHDAQRQATKDAGLIAGLKVLRIINEPTAASIAYGLDKCQDGKERNVLVFDCGGGTHDISILNIADGIFEVKATAGDSHLGGEDIDQVLVDYCLAEFTKKTGLTLGINDHRPRRRLHEACERAKRTLSVATVATIELDTFYDGKDLLVTLSRARFEELNQSFFRRVMEPVHQVLTDAKMGKADIDEIVLVGGSTRIPKIQALLKDFFGKDPCKGINPDECVAYGATVQAAILAGISSPKTDDLLLLDVTPLSLGIETAGEVMTPLIPRGTTIPTKKTQVFSTFADNQPGATIKILEGERPKSKDNHLLGEFQLEGIPAMPRGVPKIQVTYDISADGILQVTADVENAEGVQKSLTISQDEYRLSKEELDRLVQEAETFKQADDEWKRRIEAKNMYENMYWETKKQHLLRIESDEEVKDAFEKEQAWLDEQDDGTTTEVYEERLKSWLAQVSQWDKSSSNDETENTPDDEGTLHDNGEDSLQSPPLDEDSSSLDKTAVTSSPSSSEVPV